MHLTRTVVFAAFAVVWMAVGAYAKGPSFDCNKAATASEKVICADPKLSELDQLISRAYSKFEPEFDDSKHKIAQGLISDRNACADDVPCIALAMMNALQTYEVSWPGWVDSYVDGLIAKKASDYGAKNPDGKEQLLPERLGQCVSVRVEELTTRFGDPLKNADPNEGSVASFTNEGMAVSYEREAGLVDSKVGDPVVMCLASIPRDCPKGDDRGREYFGLNLRNMATWKLPDSQHSCGGA